MKTQPAPNTRLLILILLLVCQFKLLATGVEATNSIVYNDGEELYVLLDLKWKNSWNNVKNHDAIWVFFKSTPSGRNFFIAPSGHTVVKQYDGSPKCTIKLSKDKIGFFVYVVDKYRGDVNVRLKIRIDKEALGNFNVYSGTLQIMAIEMVHIPSASFWLGEADTAKARQYASFYKSNEAGKHEGLYQISSENEIRVGKEKGNLYYASPQAVYNGDQTGIISQAFPKGFSAFYLMKYEISQGQYATFLNSISASQTHHRVNFSGRQYYDLRGTIRFDGKNYLADKPDRPANFISWDDAMAYADWAGLRPYTEMEFEKACRGSAMPMPRSFPWSSESKVNIERKVNEEGDLVLANKLNESQLNDGNLEQFAASHYWVMDLSGSMWERVITIGDERGRSFTGSHGDGRISEFGFATNKDWPDGISEKGGYGFRGGGFYNSGRTYGEFNPYSPVSYRPFASWSGGNRSEAYGSRFARTDE